MVFQGMQKEDIVEFKQQMLLWSATIGPCEAIYVPPGVIVVDRVQRGIEMGMV